MEQEQKGISLINIIISFKIFLGELKKKWLLVSVIILITTTLGLLYSLNSKPKYIATSTMMLENSKSGGAMTGALALASQFGIMGGGSPSVITEEKLMEIIKSENIIKTALFKKVTINSTSDILANHFIDLFGYRKKWEMVDSLKNFKFVNKKENLSVLENGVFKMFYDQIAQNFLILSKSPSGIISLKIKTSSELFSKDLNQALLEAVTSFYINHITQKGRINVDIIQNRVDSIAGALKDAEFALARWKDANFQLVKAQGMMAEIQLRRNVEVNNSIYIEGVKQLEMAKFSLLQDTPFLQIIDQPTLPLDPMKIPLKFSVFFGFIIGCLLSGLFVFTEKKYADLMLEVQKEKIVNEKQII